MPGEFVTHEQCEKTKNEQFKAYVSWVVFVWAMGIASICVLSLFGLYAKVDSKLNANSIEFGKLQVQLANIQEDILDIKLVLKDKK